MFFTSSLVFILLVRGRSNFLFLFLNNWIFTIFRIIKVSVGVISLSLRLIVLDLDYFRYHKTNLITVISYVALKKTTTDYSSLVLSSWMFYLRGIQQSLCQYFCVLQQFFSFFLRWRVLLASMQSYCALCKMPLTTRHLGIALAIIYWPRNLRTIQ